MDAEDVDQERMTVQTTDGKSLAGEVAGQGFDDLQLRTGDNRVHLCAGRATGSRGHVREDGPATTAIPAATATPRCRRSPRPMSRRLGAQVDVHPAQRRRACR